MSASKIVLTTVLTTLTALVFVVVAAVSLLPFGAEAHGGFRGHWSGDGAHAGNRHERALQRCQSMSPAHTRVVEAAISAGLNLDDSQEQSLAPVISVLDEWRQSTADTCAQLAGEEQSLEQHLSAMEQVLRTSADSLAELRPAMTNFAAGLDAEQRDRIQSLMQRHHGG